MFDKRKKHPSVDVTKLSSLIAEGVEITGDLSFSGGIRIDGRVKGNLIGRAVEGQARALLVLSEKGHIDGTVTCGDAVINGTVDGDLDIEHFLELQSNSRVSGGIRYGDMQMDVGAAVRGQLCKSEPAPAADNVVALSLDAANRK